MSQSSKKVKCWSGWESRRLYACPTRSGVTLPLISGPALSEPSASRRIAQLVHPATERSPYSGTCHSQPLRRHRNRSNTRATTELASTSGSARHGAPTVIISPWRPQISVASTTAVALPEHSRTSLASGGATASRASSGETTVFSPHASASERRAAHYADGCLRTRKRRMVTSPDRVLPIGSRSILPRPGDEKRVPSPSSTGNT